MAGNSTKRYFGFERTFAALVIVLLLMNLPFFLGYVLPQNDSLNSFHLFYFSYNEYFVNGEFPRWIPFGFYGFQSDLYALLTAPDCFAAIVGRLLGITNVFTMYKFVVFLDQFILLTGAYLLSKRLFKHRTTVIFVCITIILSQVFYYQIYFNMRTYEWLPLLFFLVLRFYDTMRFKYIASMMIVFIMVIIGIGPYHAPVILLPVLIFFFFLLFKNYKKLKDILPLSKNDLAVTTVLMIFFAVLTGALLIYLKLSLESSYSHNIGRDPKTLTTTLEVFLTYASYTIGFKKFIGLIYPGRLYIISGITIHIGFIALAFVAYAVIFVRRIEFYAFLFIIVIFTLFSLGKITPVAEFLYHYFPTMKYFRHIGHTVAHFKIFLPFMAAFGIDHLLSRESFSATGGVDEKDRAKRHFVFAVMLAVSILLLYGTYVYFSEITPNKTLIPLICTAAFILALLSLKRFFAPNQHFKFFLIAAAIVHMASYQGVVTKNFRPFTKARMPFTGDTVQVSDYSFQPVRTDHPYSKRARNSLHTVVNTFTRPYALAYNFLQWDPCIPRFRIDIQNIHVSHLFTIRGAHFENIGNRTAGREIKMPFDRPFLESIGCYSPKIKLMRNIVFADSLEEASNIVQSEKAINRVIVLNNVDKGLKASWEKNATVGSWQSHGAFNVTDFTAHSLNLDAVVPETGGAWLYYADAFHSGWKAYVNGKETPIAQANVAFKAVYLPQGKSSVRFLYDKEWTTFTGRLLKVFETIFMIVLLIFLVRMVFFREPEST